MNPTNKLVSDLVAYVFLLTMQARSFLTMVSRMQACYVNTTHPDFISGHKVLSHISLTSDHPLTSLQAMQIVQDRLNANKPPPPTIDPKSGKLPPGALNNNKDLDVDLKREEQSFFGSFFAGGKNAAKRKGGAIMESVRIFPAVKRRLKLKIGSFIASFDSLYYGTASSGYPSADGT